MSTITKLIAAAMVALLTITSAQAAPDEWDLRDVDSNGNYIYYKITSGNELEVVDVENSNCTKLTIPQSIQIKTSSTTTTYRVTAIGEWALAALYKLTEVSLPTSIKRIKANAFDNCNNLSKINLSSLTSLEVIEKLAFGGCQSLTSVYLPTYLDEIGDKAFFGCTNLQELHLGDRTRILGSYILGYEKPKKLSKLTGQFTRNNEFLIYNNILQAWAGYGKTVCNVPSWVTAVGAYAFYNNTTLKEVTFYRTVTDIGAYAFYGCSNLTSVQFSDNSVKKIYSYAFAKCSSLTQISLPNMLTYLGEGAFLDCSSLNTILEIPATLTKLPAYGFYGCKNQQIVKFPETLTEIGDYCFYGSAFRWETPLALFPASLKRIGLYAFWGSGVRSAIFKEGFTTIERGAFCDCRLLQWISLPSTIENIGIDAFRNCENVEGSLVLIYRSTPPVLYESTSPFAEISLNNVTLHVPKGYKGAYQYSSVWRNFGTIIDDLNPIIEVPGDVNGDGKVDISDLNVCINIILGTASQSSYPDADVNGDGKVDITDVNAIINIILG